MSIAPLFEEQQPQLQSQPKNDIIVEMTRLTLTVNQAKEDLNTLIKAFNKRFNKKQQDGAATAAALRDEVKK
jgi:N-acetyl-anhydromuramyl-L-alanine amidase AmpD